MANNTVVSFTLKCVDRASRVLTSIGGLVGKLAKGIWGLGANLGGWVTSIQSAASAVQGIFSHLWNAIKESFKFESLTIQFKTLLGSMEDARERMAALAEFAEVTPFNLEEVVKASRTLTVFSDGALGTEYSLRLVGDAAAAVGAGFDEVAFWVGRAYAMIKGGQPFGEAAMRLQELGILTPAVRTEMEALQASGAKNSEVWEAFTTRLEEFGGAMEDLSQTGDGLTSTLEDTWTAAVREFGDAFQDAAKESIGFLINLLGKLKADGTIKEWAQAALEALTPLKDLITAILGGGEERSSALKAAWDYLKSVFKYGADLVKATFEYAGNYLHAKAYAAASLFAISKSTEKSYEYLAAHTEEYASGKFYRDRQLASSLLENAGKEFRTEVAKAAESARERVAKEAEAAKAKAAETAPPAETDEEAKQRAKDDLDRQQREAEAKAAQEEWSAAVEEHKRQKAIADERARLEEEYANVQREQTELAKEVKDLDEKLKKAKEKELEYHKRALDSDFDKQKREEEKEKKRQEKRQERLEKEAEELKKRFATLSDPDALLSDDFDVSKLGHRSRAIREWLRNGKFVDNNQYSFDNMSASLKSMDGTLKQIQTNLDNLLRQS